MFCRLAYVAGRDDCDGLSPAEKEQLQGVTVLHLVDKWKGDIASTESSRYRGIRKNRGGGKWAADINVGGVRTRLGSYSREIDAARAFDKAAYMLRGRWVLCDLPSLSQLLFLPS